MISWMKIEKPSLGKNNLNENPTTRVSLVARDRFLESFSLSSSRFESCAWQLGMKKGERIKKKLIIDMNEWESSNRRKRHSQL